MRSHNWFSTKFLIPIVLLSFGLSSGPATAQNAREKAVKLLKEGSVLYGKKDHKGALDRFLRAYTLFPSFKIHFNLAMVYEDMGKPEKAARHFELFLKGEKVALPGLVKTARSRFGVLRQRLSTITLTCTESGASVVVDDQVVGKTPLETKLYLSPGKHTIAVKKDGFKEFRLDQERPFVAGVQQQVEVRLEKKAAPPPPKKIVSPPAVDTGSDDPLLVKQRRKTKTILAYSFLGASVALGVTAAVLYGMGASQGGDAHDKYTEAAGKNPPAPETEIDGYYDDIESARTKVLVGNILISAAVAALGVSIYQFITRPAAPEVSANTVPPLSVGVIRGGATLSFGCTF